MFAEAKGTKIFYTLEGSGESRVVLLHGWGCSSRLMESPASALREDHQVLALDFPGHGQSGRPPEPWGVPEYAECLKELLEKLDFLPCAAVAHSFGCRVAAWLEANGSPLFDKMVFTGAAGIRPQPSEAAQKRSARYRNH